MKATTAKHNFKPHALAFSCDKLADGNNRWHAAEEILDHVARSMFGERYETIQPRRFALDNGGLSFDLSSEADISLGSIREFLAEIYIFLADFCGVSIDVGTWSCDSWVNAEPEPNDGTRDGDDEYRVIIFCKVSK